MEISKYPEILPTTNALNDLERSYMMLHDTDKVSWQESILHDP